MSHLTKSNDRFIFTIKSSTGAYTDKTPFGKPVPLEIGWNESDQLIAILDEVDRVTDLFVDLSEVVRDDFVELRVNGNVSFFGIIIESKFIQTQQATSVKIVAQTETRILSERQVDQAIFNGFFDTLEWTVNDDLTSDLKEGLKPLAHVEQFDPFGFFKLVGNIFVSAATGLFVEGEVTFNETRGHGVAFRPSRSVIESIYFLVEDTDGFGGPIGFRDNLTVRFYEVNEDPGFTFLNPAFPLVGLRFANLNAPVFKRGGGVAEYRLGFRTRELWLSTITETVTNADITTPDLTTGWEVISTGAGSVVVTAGLPPVLTPAGGTTILQTKVPGPETFPFQSPSGMLEFDLSLTGDVSLEIDFFVMAPNDRLAGTLKINKVSGAGDIKLAADDPSDDLTVLSSYPDGDYTFSFRVDFRKLVFDFAFRRPADGSGDEWFYPAFSFNFLDRLTNFPEEPTAIGRWKLDMTGGSGTAKVNFVNGNEFVYRGSTRYSGTQGPNWVRFDMSVNPLDVVPGTWIAAVILPDDTTGSFDTGRAVIGSIPQLGLQDPEFNIRSTRPAFDHFTSGFSSGTPSTGGEFARNLDLTPSAVFPVEIPFVVEFADSWRPALEGADFVVDYGLKKIDWTLGENRIAPVTQDTYRYFTAKFTRPPEPASGPQTRISGPVWFKQIRVSEYSNPSTGGIIQSARKMRLPDVVKFLTGFVSGISSTIVDGNLDGQDDADGVGFNTDAFQIGVYVGKQASVLQLFRDLGEEFNALFSMTPTSPPDFVFEAVKTISDIDPFNPQDHEYVLTLDPDVFDADESLLAMSSNIGLVETTLFTRFPVLGAFPLRVERVNHALEAELGRKVRQPDIFARVDDEDQLWRFSDALLQVFGVRVVEGTVVVAGYFPVFDQRLDINGIVRVIDSTKPNGTDLTGIKNVFKIHRLRYNGERHQTEIFLSNRNLYRMTTDRLTELRNTLNNVDESDPKKDPARHETSTGSLSASTFPLLYMALFSSGNESTRLGYRRQLCTQRVHTDGFVSYVAAWPAGIGTILNDQHPIDEMKLFDAETVGNVKATVTFSDPHDFVYKWSHATLRAIIDIADSDQ